MVRTSAASAEQIPAILAAPVRALPATADDDAPGTAGSGPGASALQRNCIDLWSLGESNP
jgi:hypothetical protein